jgi:hypothetical protein
LALIPPLFICVMGIPQWPVSSYHWDSNLFLLASLATWLDASRRHSRLLYSMAGAFAGITALFMMQKGGLIFASLLLVTAASRAGGAFRHRFLNALAISGGAASVLLLAVWFYWSVGALEDLVSNVLWPFRNYLGVNSVPYGFMTLKVLFGVWKPLLAGVPSAIAAWISLALSLAWLAVPLLPAISFGLMMGSAFSLHHLRESLDTRAMALGLGGWALWLSELHRWDFFHLVYAAPVLIIYCCYLLDRVFSTHKQLHRASIALAAVLLISAAAQLRQVLRIGASGVPIQTRRGTVIAPESDEALQFLLNEVRQRELVFIYPYYSMYYFLADVVNPTRVTSLMYGFNTKEQFIQAVSDLERKKVKWVLSDTVVAAERLSEWFPEYQQPPAEKLIMERYLAEHYTHVRTSGGFRILRRKDSP